LQSEISNNDDYSFQVSPHEKLISKISKGCLSLGDIVNFKQGIITGGNKKYITIEKNEMSVKLLTGRDFNKYKLKPNSHFLTYDTSKLHRPRVKEIFEVAEKILLRQTGAYPIATIDNNQFYTLDTVHNGTIKDNNFDIKYILALLNSELLKFLYVNSINETGKVFAQVKIIYINPLPIKPISDQKQSNFIELVDNVLNINEELSILSSSFTTFLAAKFNIEILSKSLLSWHDLNASQFLKELEKNRKRIAKEQKINFNKLSLSEQSEWTQHFVHQHKMAQELKEKITKLNDEIDKNVYELYGLSNEEAILVKEALA
jgi:hypothetical protein